MDLADPPEHGTSPNRPLRFHWSLPQAGQPLRRALAAAAQTGVPPFEAQVALCRRAEECGTDSMLMEIGCYRPDPIVLSAALARRTGSIKFMLACRAGLISPVAFVHQDNTHSAVARGRVHVNLVVGRTPHELGYYGDFLGHDARYDRAGEFIEVCRRLWAGRGPVTFLGNHYRVEGATLHTPFVSPTGSEPEIHLGGSSDRAIDLAGRNGCCLWRLARDPEEFGEGLDGLFRSGGEAGLIASLIAQPTRGEALRAAEDLVAPFSEETRAVHSDFAHASESEDFRSAYALAEGDDGPWRGRCLWAGAVPYLGAPAVALVGSFDEVAGALIEYRRVGVSQFLFMEWPDLEEMTLFGREVLSRVRELEASEAAGPVLQGGLR